jgi:hypothetical protein
MVSFSTVFLAEVIAILKCIKIRLSTNVTRTRIHTYSESRAVRAAFALVWECTQALEKQSGSNKFTLEWIPGLHGISGKEEANKLVKEGINKLHSDHLVGIPLAVGKEFIMSHLRQENLNRFQTCQGLSPVQDAKERPSAKQKKRASENEQTKA